MPKRKKNAASKPTELETTDETQECHDQDEGPPAKRLRSKHIISPFTTPSKAVTGRAVPDERELSSDVDQTSMTASSKPAITKIYIKKLVISVPRGHQGSLHVKLELPEKTLDCSSGLNEAARPDTQDEGSAFLHQSGGDDIAKASPTPSSRSEDESRCGFLSLPAELRDMIYEEAFVSKNERHIAPIGDTDTRLCAALLRTCRQVHQEGRKWLYSENKFFVRSDWRCSGGYWESKWNTLGYETMKVWLSTIGTENLQLLRDVSLHLVDFSIRNRPYGSIEERRFVIDQQLSNILDHLAGCKNLKQLKVIFSGRRRLYGTGDERPFFRRLMKIKADHVELRGSYSGEPIKVCSDLLEQCYDAMEREQVKEEGEEDDDDDDD